MKMAANGATLILLDIPEGTEIGIDYMCWNIGPRFKGIKLIPPGLHFVYYSAVSNESQTAPRTGFFHWFDPGEVLVRLWDPLNEELTQDKTNDKLLEERLKSNISGDLNAFLCPYPQDQLKKWVTHTNYITPSLIKRVQPENGIISAVTRVQDKERIKRAGKDTPISATPITVSTGGGYFSGVGNFPEITTATEQRLQKGISLIPYKESTLRFSPILQYKHPHGATPTEITRNNMDLSHSLESLISINYPHEPLNVLGELQISFTCFIIGQVYEAFEQWKRLVHILCLSESSLVERESFFMDFVSVLHFHLREIPEDFFIDIVTRNNFLTSTLQVFFYNVKEREGLNGEFKERVEKFQTHLTKKFQWDFTSEPDDELPVIVNLENS